VAEQEDSAGIHKKPVFSKNTLPNRFSLSASSIILDSSLGRK
jgi:hypothetical protein